VKRGPQRLEGFTLIEVLAAMLLLSLFLGSISTAFLAVHTRLGDQHQRLASAAAQPGDDAWTQQWSWGPQLREASWDAAGWLSGALWRGTISGTESTGQPVVIGIWKEGLLLEERELGDPRLPLRIVHLPSDAGSTEELTFRARDSLGYWGPPYRIVVGTPDAEERAASMPPVFSEAMTPADALDVPVLVARAPFRGRATFEATQSSGIAPIEDPTGFGVLPPDATGVTFQGRSQGWLSDGWRSFDVYF